MALVDDQQRVAWQVIEQAWRWLPGLASGQIPGVVLDARAVPDFVHHLEVEARALLEALCLDELARGAQLHQPATQLVTDLVERTRDVVPWA